MRISSLSVLLSVFWMLFLTSLSFGQQRKALFVARLDAEGNVTAAFEPEIVARLQLLGYEVTIVDDQWSTSVDAAAGKDLLYIAESGSSGNADVFRDLPIPAIFSEAFGWDNWDWGTGTAAWVPDQTQIDIVDPAHPLAAGLTGTVDVYTTPAQIQGKAVAELTAPGVHVVASIAGDPTQATLVAVEAGGQLLNSRIAPARQVGFFFGGPDSLAGPGFVTTDGWTLFDAAVRWADPLEPPSAPLNLTARPGDGEVALEWDAPTSGPVEGYHIHQSETSGGPYTEVATTDLLAHTVGGLTNDTTYYFVVTAFNAAGDGAQSNEASAMPQAGFSLPVRRWHLYR